MNASPSEILAALWQHAALDSAALAQISLTGAEPIQPSSFRVDAAAQASIAASGLRQRKSTAGAVVPRRVSRLQCAMPLLSFAQNIGSASRASPPARAGMRLRGSINVAMGVG
jgi:hypothetical protein